MRKKLLPVIALICLFSLVLSENHALEGSGAFSPTDAYSSYRLKDLGDEALSGAKHENRGPVQLMTAQEARLGLQHPAHLSGGKSGKTINLDSIDEKLEGKAKLGISLGYPTGITFGYQMTKTLELNVTAGLVDFDDAAFCGSLLFTLADFEIDGELFPLSFGPAVHIRTGGKGSTDLLGVLRLEYTFEDSPVNLFIEGGAGLEIMPDTRFRGSGALGIRYVF